LLHTLSLLMMTNPVSGALSRSQVKKKLRKNSPIYYIQTPYNFVNSQPFLSGLSTYSSLSSSLLMNRHVNRPLISSTLYHLPTKYVSNAKPVDVSSKKTSKKKGKSCHASSLIWCLLQHSRSCRLTSVSCREIERESLCYTPSYSNNKTSSCLLKSDTLISWFDQLSITTDKRERERESPVTTTVHCLPAFTVLFQQLLL
jgi:hypothetical protein